ncbi:MAG: citrate transporter [Ignavibacteriaceae bacterium]|nr:citrate transporter [Ignavibacteriaceae bacterium]
MMHAQIILLIGVFLFMALMMFLRKIPALIALPVMALLIALIGGINFDDMIEYVIGQGSLKLHQAYTIALFGSMLSVLMQKTGVAEAFIKKGAELSGDNPWLIAVIMLLLIIALFTTLGGLGAIIMVATIVLPIMSSVGIGSMTSVGIFLFGLSIGGILNVGNWAVYISVMGLTVDEIRPFAVLMFLISFLGAIVYITVQIYRDGHDLDFKKIILRSSVIIILLSLLYFLITSVASKELQDKLSLIISQIGIGLKWIIAVGIILLFISALIRIVLHKNENAVQPHWISFLSPILPLFLILLFDVNFIAAFIVGLIYAFLTTYKKGRLNLFIQACFEGGGVVMPAVVLMFGIGMMLVAIMGPGGNLPQYSNGWPVLNIIKPLMAHIVPTNAIMYVLIFTVAAPLALYRGPLNVWGMGYGIAAVFLASGMNPGAVMGLLLAVGQIQGISDPTNTHNVWLTNEMRVDVQKVLWNTISYTWILAIVGLIISSIMFM